VVEVLLDWAWHPRRTTRDTSPLPLEVARLATLILGWMLATPDRRVRDRATKALASLGERGPAGFAAGVKQFRGCDDSYVVERIAAAVCAVALRSPDAEVVLEVADAAVELVADGWPVHLLTCDYLRHTSEAAREHGWSGPDWFPPYGAKWPVRASSAKTIESMVKPPDYKLQVLVDLVSLNGMMGDFGRYVLEPALEHFEHDDHKKLRSLAERAIFTCAVKLGWTPRIWRHKPR
jgi:hypothetical protein